MKPAFQKSVGGDFDRIDIESYSDDDWLRITMRVGHDVERVAITLRSTEAVRDLHYALGRYLEHMEAK